MPFSIRAARPGDEVAIFNLIRELARFERLEHALEGSAAQLKDALFGARPAAEALVAERSDRIVGYAIFFTTFSTFLTRSGIWLEDLFVSEAERGLGIGKALFRKVATIAHERHGGRFEWAVLDWNQRAIDFYAAHGAGILSDWRICRLSGEPLRAQTRPKPTPA